MSEHPQLLHTHCGEPRDAGSVSDRDFFLLNSGRDYRLRLATQAEAARYARVCGWPVSRDWFVYTATKQFLPGMRVRKYLAGRFTGSPGEALAKEVYDWLENAR